MQIPLLDFTQLLHGDSLLHRILRLLQRVHELCYSRSAWNNRQEGLPYIAGRLRFRSGSAIAAGSNYLEQSCSSHELLNETAEMNQKIHYRWCISELAFDTFPCNLSKEDGCRQLLNCRLEFAESENRGRVRV